MKNHKKNDDNEPRQARRGGACLLAGTFEIRLWAEPLINVAEGAERGTWALEGRCPNLRRTESLADAVVSHS